MAVSVSVSLFLFLCIQNLGMSNHILKRRRTSGRSNFINDFYNASKFQNNHNFYDASKFHHDINMAISPGESLQSSQSHLRPEASTGHSVYDFDMDVDLDNAELYGPDSETKSQSDDPISDLDSDYTDISLDQATVAFEQDMSDLFHRPGDATVQFDDSTVQFHLELSAAFRAARELLSFQFDDIYNPRKIEDRKSGVVMNTT